MILLILKHKSRNLQLKEEKRHLAQMLSGMKSAKIPKTITCKICASMNDYPTSGIDDIVSAG